MSPAEAATEGGVFLSPQAIEWLLYGVIFLIGGEKGLRMIRRKSSGDTLTDGKAIVAKIAALEKAIEEAKESIKEIAHVRESVAAMREAIDSLKDSVRDIWDEIKELRKAG